MPIEEWLSWAYLVELPKAGAARASGPGGPGRAWAGVERFGALLAEVDCALPLNRFGLAIDPTAEAGPHPDALALAAAVAALDDMALDLPEDWSPLADIDDGDPLYAAAVVRGLARIVRTDAQGRRVLSIRPSDLVRKHAILGGAPDTAAERPVRKIETAHGRPLWFRRVLRAMPTIDGGERMVEVEVDGFDRCRRVPHPDAYQRAYLDPDPADAVVARAEYEIWRSALDVLAEAVSGMAAGNVEPCRWPRRPWIDGAPQAPRILLAAPESETVTRSGDGSRLNA